MINPPTRSLYRKIYLVLIETRKGRFRTIESLIKYFTTSMPNDFTRYKESKPVALSQKTIEAVVLLTEELGFINTNSMILTQAGEKATNSNQFPFALRKALINCLEKIDIPIKRIKDGLIEIYSDIENNQVPTWDIIYSKLGSEDTKILKKKFQTYMSLLSMCEGINFTRKKIYLP